MMRHAWNYNKQKFNKLTVGFIAETIRVKSLVGKTLISLKFSTIKFLNYMVSTLVWKIGVQMYKICKLYNTVIYYTAITS